MISTREKRKRKKETKTEKRKRGKEEKMREFRGGVVLTYCRDEAVMHIICDYGLRELIKELQQQSCNLMWFGQRTVIYACPFHHTLRHGGIGKEFK